MIRVRGDVNERSTVEITTTINDVDGTVLTPDDLASLTLTLYDEQTEDILNDRDAQDVLNVNGGTLSDVGAFTMRLDPDDNVIVGDPDRDNYYKTARDGSLQLQRPSYKEWHVLLLAWETASSPSNVGNRKIGVRVRNLAKVPSE